MQLPKRNATRNGDSSSTSVFVFVKILRNSFPRYSFSIILTLCRQAAYCSIGIPSNSFSAEFASMHGVQSVNASRVVTFMTRAMTFCLHTAPNGELAALWLVSGAGSAPRRSLEWSILLKSGMICGALYLTIPGQNCCRSSDCGVPGSALLVDASLDTSIPKRYPQSGDS